MKRSGKLFSPCLIPVSQSTPNAVKELPITALICVMAGIELMLGALELLLDRSRADIASTKVVVKVIYLAGKSTAPGGEHSTETQSAVFATKSAPKARQSYVETTTVSNALGISQSNELDL